MLFRSPTITNRLLAEVLPQGSWTGHPAFLVGGGPSLEGFDYSKLLGHRSIGVNLAFTMFSPTISFSMDTRFLNWIMTDKYPAGTLAKWKKFSGYKVWCFTYSASLPEDIFAVPVYGDYTKGLTALSWNMESGIGHGNNSGFAALNLALVLGADPIYLLGYDMKHNNGRSHWHAGHPVPQAEGRVIKFRRPFEAHASEIAKAGRTIINLNPDSGLRCFNFKTVDEVLG